MAFTHPVAQKLPLTTPSQAITPPPAYGHDQALSTSVVEYEEDCSDEDEGLSSIHLRINTPLVVNGDNNLVAIDPAASASKIAMAVVAAIKQMSMGESGVPMIDEEGRPRPIKVDVTAETRVEGSKNVVGEKAVLAAVVCKEDAKKKGAEESSDNVGTKRQWEESEPGEGDGKRVRTQ